MASALIIASRNQPPLRPAANKMSTDDAEPLAGKETDSEESAEEKAKYSVEVPVEGDEIDLKAPDGVDLNSVKQTGRAVIDYTLQCQPDGSECRVIISKVCFEPESGESAESDDNEAGAGDESAEDGELPASGQGFAALLQKSVEKAQGKMKR
jgi:hypothetical protein